MWTSFLRLRIYLTWCLLNQGKSSIEDDYSSVCSTLKLKPDLLDIYEYKIDSDNMTQHDTALRDTFAAYYPSKLTLPIADDGNASDNIPIFPPTDWRRLNSYQWPPWRIDLWHEIVHQVEDQILNEHGESWAEAISYVAEKFSVDQKTIEGLM